MLFSSLSFLVSRNDHSLSFDTFTCDYTDCCQWTESSYEIVDGSSGSVLPSITCCEAESGGSYSFQVGVSTAQTFKLKIKATNSVGDVAYSSSAVDVVIAENGILEIKDDNSTEAE